MSTQPENAEPDKEQLAEGTLMSHLLELRSRLMWAAMSVVAVFVCLVPFAQRVFEIVSAPLIAVLPEGSEMIATDVASPFLTPFKTTFFVALFLAMPVVLFQVWQFVAPGLYKHEKRFAVPLLVSSILLFYVGVAFAYLIVFPVMFQFFAGTTPAGVRMMTDIASYLDFITTMFFCFGLAFEVPVVVVLLVLTGITTVDKLAASRGYVLIGIFVIAAILTPPDAVSQTIMAVPMYLLYEGGLIMARLMSKMRRPEPKDEAEA